MKFPSMKQRKEIPQMKSELEKVAVALESLAEAFRKLAEDHSDKAVERTVEPEVTMTIEEVRSILTARSREGFTKDVKALLLKHGAGCLRDINPSEYKSLVAEAEALGNG